MSDQTLNKLAITQTELDKIMRGKNINFLIGAGASVPLYKTLKKMMFFLLKKSLPI